jgi:hypothetical protein
VLSFSATQVLSKTDIHDKLVAALQENAVSYSSVTRFYREAILGLNSGEISSSPKDDGLDEVNQEILLALYDESFSSVPSVEQIADSPPEMRSKKSWILSPCRFSPFHNHTSDIFIGFLTSSPTVRRQIESSRIELSIQFRDLLLSIQPQG